MAGRILAIILSFSCAVAGGAEFHFIPDGPGAQAIVMHGKIEAGDAKKLERWISAHPCEYISTNNIFLISDGGSIQEAIEIAKIVEASGWRATTEGYESPFYAIEQFPHVLPSHGRCASACFFIFASAQIRGAIPGTVIVHRPYFDAAADSPSDHMRQINEQSVAAMAARDFLLAKGVSSGLVDKVMSLPSSRGYTLTQEDLDDLGVLAPVLEEQTIRRCSVDNGNYWENYFSQPGKTAYCVEKVVYPLRLNLVKNKLGKKALSDAIKSRYTPGACEARRVLN